MRLGDERRRRALHHAEQCEHDDDHCNDDGARQTPRNAQTRPLKLDGEVEVRARLIEGVERNEIVLKVELIRRERDRARAL